MTLIRAKLWIICIGALLIAIEAAIFLWLEYRR